MQRLFSSGIPLAAPIFTSQAFQLSQGFSIASPLPMAFGASGVVENDMLSGTCQSNQPGILIFQHSDDTAIWENIGCFSVVSSTVINSAYTSIQVVPVRKLNWRFIYINTGPVAPTSFSLYINGFNTLAPSVDMYGNVRAQTVDSYYSD